MSETIIESVMTWNRRGGAEEIESLKQIRAKAWDEHTHSFRWLMASLLGINGAACLGILSKDEIPPPYRLIAGGIFIFGVIMALLVAVLGQQSIQRILGPVQKLIGYWMTVAEDGIRDEELEAGFNDELKSSAKLSYASRAAGWASALAFLIGAVTAGLGLKSMGTQLPASKYSIRSAVTETRLSPQCVSPGTPTLRCAQLACRSSGVEG